MASAAQQPVHTSESIADRRKNRELVEARQSGNAAPEVDVKTGAIINPHNPEFITRRPWYLGGSDAGPSLDHQSDQRALGERLGVTLAASDYLVKQQREKTKELYQLGFQALETGMWLEGLKKNRKPYIMCKVVLVDKKKRMIDIEYEDGTVERNIKWPKSNEDRNARLRLTKLGSRIIASDNVNDSADGLVIGKETYDSKRDVYHGVEVDDQQREVIQKFQRRDEMRKQRRAKALQEDEQKGESTSNNSVNERKVAANASDSSDYDSSDQGSDSEDEFVQKDADAKTFSSRLARQGGVGGAQMKVTARNLRIREDTAKYLRNLDLNSAYYDPKSRSMRDNPYPETNPGEVPFAGDNFARISGDAVGLAETQVFCWDAGEKGFDELHPQANPSQAELLKKQFKEKSTNISKERGEKLLDTYGGTEYLDGCDGLAGVSLNAGRVGGGNDMDDSFRQDRKVRFGTAVQMEEYSRDGRLVKGATGATISKLRGPIKSKYNEDIFSNGHTTIFGSYFHKGAFRWGFADDHNLIRNSYCTGLNGRHANDEANSLRFGDGRDGSAQLAQMQQMLNTGGSGSIATKVSVSSPAVVGSKLYGEVGQFATLEKEKVAAALTKLEEEEREFVKDERKRRYNAVNASGFEVTAEEMEAYHLKKSRGGDDPLSKISSDAVLEYHT